MNVNDFNTQFPETLLLITRALRGGYSVKQTFELVAEYAPEPTASVFKDVTQHWQDDKSSQEVLKHLKHVIASDYVEAFVDVVLKQAQTGGNLAILLDGFNITQFGEPQSVGWMASVPLEDGYDFETHKPRNQ